MTSWPNILRIVKASARALLGKIYGRGVSSNYVEIRGDIEKREEAVLLTDSWRHESIPTRQRKLVERELTKFRSGAKVKNFSIMQQALRDLRLTSGPVSLLEIGCSSGYYSEVIEGISPGFSYHGCDYSTSFIEMAKAHYPSIPFDVEDATRLNYPDNHFDVVLSGCCLLHIPNYEAAITETARVSKTFSIFHRTPVVIGGPQQVFRKKAYGVDTIEIHFQETDFLRLLRESSLDLLATYSLSEPVGDHVGTAVRTYVCQKRKALK